MNQLEKLTEIDSKISKFLKEIEEEYGVYSNYNSSFTAQRFTGNINFSFKKPETINTSLDALGLPVGTKLLSDNGILYEVYNYKGNHKLPVVIKRITSGKIYQINITTALRWNKAHIDKFTKSYAYEDF